MAWHQSTTNWQGFYASVIDAASIRRLSCLFRKVPVIYIMASYGARRTWVPLYVGKAVDGHGRLRDHEKYPEALKWGWSHVHVITSVAKWALAGTEQFLIDTYHPHLKIRSKISR